MMLLYKKKVSMKSQAFLVEGVRFLRKMSGAYLFCSFQRVENCEEGVSLVEAGVAGVMGGHKGFIVGLAICHGKDCHRSLQGAANETPLLSRVWLTLGCPAPLPRLDRPPAALGQVDPAP